MFLEFGVVGIDGGAGVGVQEFRFASRRCIVANQLEVGVRF